MDEKKPELKKSLSDDEILSSHPSEKDPSRRSMLTTVGSAMAVGTAATMLPGCFRRAVVVGPRPAGAVVVNAPAPVAVYQTGVTDSDGGPYADPAGAGRGARRTVCSGVTDSDGGSYADAAGCGRGRYGMTSGLTDSDSGAYADPAGNGRGTARGGGYTGLTDSDGGPYADAAGQGRGRWR